MARSKRTPKRKVKPTSPKPASLELGLPVPGRRLQHELLALLLLALDVFLVLSLASYFPGEWAGATTSGAGLHNWGGKAGAFLSYYLMGWLGLAAFWLPIMVCWLALQVFQGSPRPRRPVLVLAYLGLPLTSAGLLTLGWPVVAWGPGRLLGGGSIGRALTAQLLPWLNTAGTTLVLVAVLLASFMGLTRISYVGLLQCLRDGLQTIGRRVRLRSVPRPEPSPAVMATPIQAPETITPEVISGAPETAPVTPSVIQTEPAALPPPTPAESTRTRGKKLKSYPVSAFRLPALDLLLPPPRFDHQVQEEALLAQARKLETTLTSFGVEGKVTAIRPGPVITMIEFEPALGVKISKVTSLADDLALALKAISIRIVAPVPGKAVIGIEVPNPKRQIVALKEILGHESYQKSPSRLTMALGKDITGQPVITDLAKMPHLLIAGATGTGKSVGLNAMIVSILYKATPDEVRFLMVDPKRIELSTYEGIPHLLHPVVTNPKVATNALRWAVMEMERRYELLSELSVRNIETFNQKLIKEKKVFYEDDDEDGEPRSRLLPFLIIVIDELADLMLVSSRETEEYLIRLAQKSRAAGIHLILATQRPSVDVITGLIKANFPTRISFQVSSRVDSRTILDTMGAERLLGMGDMLFMPPGTSQLKRIHGAYVSEEEVQQVVDYLKRQQAPTFEPGIADFQEEETGGEEALEKDDKYEEALAIVAETRQASISMLQRRLRIGYNRAARIIEVMEKEGLVGPSDGIKPREVYLSRM